MPGKERITPQPPRRWIRSDPIFLTFGASKKFLPWGGTPGKTFYLKEETMRKGLLLALVGVLLVAPPVTSLAAQPEMKYIDLETLKGMLGDPQVMIIDVRVPSSWADSDKKIKAAVRQDPGKVPTWAKTLAKDQKIVLYCS